MRHRSTVLAAALLATLAVTGCEPPGSAPPDEVDWPRVAGRDLNCADDTVEVVGDVDRYDIDQDGEPDHFVTMRCKRADGSRTEPGQLEVFKGGTPRDNPARLAVIVRNWQEFQLSGCVSFAQGKAYTRGVDGETEAVWGAHYVSVGKTKRVVGFRSDDTAQIAGCD